MVVGTGIETGIIMALIGVLGVALKLMSIKEYKSNINQHNLLEKTMNDGFKDIISKLEIMVENVKTNTDNVGNILHTLQLFEKERGFKVDINNAFQEAIMTTPDETLIKILNVLKTKILADVKTRLDGGLQVANSMEIDVSVNAIEVEISDMISIYYGEKTLKYIKDNIHEYLFDFKKNLHIVLNDIIVNNVICRYKSEVLNLTHRLIAEISRAVQLRLDKK